MKKNDWHIRISLTDLCNFRCVYCNPDALRTKKKTVSFEQVKLILEAAYENEINRVHWTGGEPTLFRDGDHNIVDVVNYAKQLGYCDQVMTTNGSIFYKIATDLCLAGLNRVNVSIDSLYENRNKDVTGRSFLKQTKSSLEEAVKKFKEDTKMNVVAMRDTIPELLSMVEYADHLMNLPYAKGKVVIKLIEICPNNPAQLQEKGERFFFEQHVGRDELMKAADRIGSLKRLEHNIIPGDNPNAHYFLIGDSNVAVGFVTMPSTGWPCGKDYCHKLRVTPYGGAAVCLQKPIINLVGYNKDELIKKIALLKDERQELEIILPNRIHFRPQLGEMRFGDLDKKYTPKSAEYFVDLCKKV